jgi:U3 small nucleolar RNA-associated protein 16
VLQKINFHNTDYNLTHNDELSHQTLCPKGIPKNSMFSRLYKSAKAILIDSAESEKTQPTPIVEPPPDETMVTTRQKDTQNADHQIEEEDSINVYVLSSSSKRQRKGAKGKSSSEEDEAEYVPPSSRKRKRLPVRAKDSPDIGKTRPVVEIPVKKISPEPNNGNTSASDEEEEEEQQGTKARDEEHAAASAKSVEKSKHRRFGSEPAEDEFFSTAGEVVNDTGRSTFEVGEDSGVIEDSEDSEDEAPEAVGIHEAAEHVKSKDREAARVVQE